MLHRPRNLRQPSVVSLAFQKEIAKPGRAQVEKDIPLTEEELEAQDLERAEKAEKTKAEKAKAQEDGTAEGGLLQRLLSSSPWHTIDPCPCRSFDIVRSDCDLVQVPKLPGQYGNGLNFFTNLPTSGKRCLHSLRTMVYSCRGWNSHRALRGSVVSKQPLRCRPVFIEWR